MILVSVVLHFDIVRLRGRGGGGGGAFNRDFTRDSALLALKLEKLFPAPRPRG